MGPCPYCPAAFLFLFLQPRSHSQQLLASHIAPSPVLLQCAPGCVTPSQAPDKQARYVFQLQPVHIWEYVHGGGMSETSVPSSLPAL